ncbi:MAG TPA: flagellar hook-basal body complex protein FliE [Nocardioidaceae bacterium]|nr:flagellar hook-basal body complex protein FliE [Nocardioidaceae bacterium]
MSIPAIEPSGFVPFVAPSVPASTSGAAPVGATDGIDFSTMLSTGIERLEGLHDRADSLAVQAATGDLSQIHDYTITATEAAVSTQLTTAVRNKALEAFQEIMRIAI